MNNKPSIDDIISFIYLAMENEYIIDASSSGLCWVEIEKSPSEIIQFRIWPHNGNILEVITNDRGYFTIDNLSVLDIAKFKLVIEKCKKYKEEIGIENFNKFFKSFK